MFTLQTYLLLALIFLCIDVILMFAFNHYKKQEHIEIKDHYFVFKCFSGSFVSCFAVGVIRLLVYLPSLQLFYINDAFQDWWWNNFQGLWMYYVSGENIGAIIYFVLSILIIMPLVKKYVNAWILDKKELQPIRRKMSIILTIGITPWILLYPNIQALAEEVFGVF